MGDLTCLGRERLVGSQGAAKKSCYLAVEVEYSIRILPSDELRRGVFVCVCLLAIWINDTKLQLLILMKVVPNNLGKWFHKCLLFVLRLSQPVTADSDLMQVKTSTDNHYSLESVPKFTAFSVFPLQSKGPCIR